MGVYLKEEVALTLLVGYDHAMRLKLFVGYCFLFKQTGREHQKFGFL